MSVIIKSHWFYPRYLTKEIVGASRFHTVRVFGYCIGWWATFYKTKEN